jgi:hypothetical protein
MRTRRLVRLLLLALPLAVRADIASAEDTAQRFMREAFARAEYWQARGYNFDPLIMSADSMDRKVEDINRAAYWKERGFEFDARSMSAATMDRKAEATLRVEYWKRWGIQFDAQVMDAEMMDDAAVKLQEAQEIIEKMQENGETPMMIMDRDTADTLLAPPKIKGANQVARRVAPGQVPMQVGDGNMGGMGMGMGGGGMGNAGGFGGGMGGGPPVINLNDNDAQRSGGARATGGLQIPPGVEIEDFLMYLQELRRR